MVYRSTTIQTMTIEKHLVYEMEAPNGATILAYAVSQIMYCDGENLWLMYSQNRLFTIQEKEGTYKWWLNQCDYCIIPEADKTLEDASNSNNVERLNIRHL